MTEILLYTGIYSFTAEEFINKLNEIPKDEDIIVRLNSPGGSVFAGWGIIAALKERTGKNILKVDGNASSMAFFMVPFFDEVHALDVTSFMIHRASAWVQTEDDQKMLDNANKDLRVKLEKTIDKKLFEEVTGVSIKEIFEGEKRRNIWLTAKEAKKIGLVKKVTRLEPSEIAAFNENFIAFSNFKREPQGSGDQLQGSGTEKEEVIINIKTESKMTIAELKEKHPELYAQIYSLGVSSEKDRIQAWLAFNDIDAKAVTEGIDKDQQVSQKVFAEMTRKGMSAKLIADAEADSPEAIEAAKQEAEAKKLTKEAKEALEAENKVRIAAGLEPLKTDEK